MKKFSLNAPELVASVLGILAWCSFFVFQVWIISLVVRALLKYIGG